MRVISVRAQLIPPPCGRAVCRQVNHAPSFFVKEFERRSSTISGTISGTSSGSVNGYGGTFGLQPSRGQAAMDVSRDCMAQRGYSTVPVAVAESSGVR
jgi:hypothetical protein